MSWRLLDLYSCAGGAARGYQQAGFHVTGVDINPQPRYAGDDFHQGDALEYLAEHVHEFDAVHGSPPCQDHSRLKSATGRTHGTGWLLSATREAFKATNLPWVIENVPGAPMRADYRLCGCMFDLPGLRRERWFETSWQGFDLRPPCSHYGQTVTVAGHGMQGWEYAAGKRHDQADREAAMGIDWMSRDELAQAIPPAFTAYIGAALLEQLEECAA